MSSHSDLETEMNGPWGDRYGVIEDPFRYRWSIATPVRKTPLTREKLEPAARAAR